MSDNHGNTWAAWTAVALGILGFVVGGVGLMVFSWVTFWVGVALLPLAVLAGIVLSRLGFGASNQADRGAR